MTEPRSFPQVQQEELGRATKALLPIEKLGRNSPRGVPFERELHDFLLINFGGYTVSSGAISGHWADSKGSDKYEEHREYCVAIPSREGLEAFEVFLASLAEELGEDCILLETGARCAWFIGQCSAEVFGQCPRL